VDNFFYIIIIIIIIIIITQGQMLLRSYAAIYVHQLLGFRILLSWSSCFHDSENFKNYWFSGTGNTYGFIAAYNEHLVTNVFITLLHTQLLHVILNFFD
jgi:hypothetical protein